MIELVTTAVMVLAGAVTVFALGCFSLAGSRPRALDRAVVVLEGGLVLRAMLGVGAIVSGQHAFPGGTHVAYLVTSVAILPVALGTLVDDQTRWSAAVLAVTCLAVLVVALRLQMTWDGHA